MWCDQLENQTFYMFIIKSFDYPPNSPNRFVRAIVCSQSYLGDTLEKPLELVETDKEKEECPVNGEAVKLLRGSSMSTNRY